MKFPWKRVIKKKKQQAPYLCEKQPYRFGTILYTTFHIPSTQYYYLPILQWKEFQKG